jgi:hypothetical protein
MRENTGDFWNTRDIATPSWLSEHAEFPSLDLDALSERLRGMSDAELLSFGREMRALVHPLSYGFNGKPVRCAFSIQLIEAMLITSVRYFSAASFTPVAAARLVLPTPPFPLNRRILIETIIRPEREIRGSRGDGGGPAYMLPL